MVIEVKNDALHAEGEYRSAIEEAYDYIENFDILETITNVGNDEVFTPRKTVEMMLDSLPEEVWHNPNYKWLNPATKNGIFEREIAIRLDEGLKDIILDTEIRRKHILQNMIFAIGQTKFTANVARRTLYYCSSANRKCDGILAEDGHYVNGYAIGNGSWFDTPEGNILTPCTDHTYINSSGRLMLSSCKGDERKKYRCKFCGISGNSAYNDANQREKYAYEWIHVEHLCLKHHLQDRFFNGDRTMKFDIIIGNPPYQLSDGGAQASARPIYNLFVEQAKKLLPKYLCMIIPSRWMAGGKGLDEFRKEMINDKHIRIIHDFLDPKKCFPNNDIKGGVCYFLWERDNEGPCRIYTHNSDNSVDVSYRFLKEKGLDIFVRNDIQLSILKKVLAYGGEDFSKIVSPRKPYGLSGDFFKDPAKYALPPISEEKIPYGYTIYGLDKHQKRVERYVSSDYPLPKREGLDKFKIFIARAYGCGLIGEVPSTPILSTPSTLCTETFLQIGPFENEIERDNCYSYLKTKFFRILVGIRKITQDCTKEAYSFVPLLDFKKSWNDEELYKMFKLTKEEIEYIETNIKEMI